MPYADTTASAVAYSIHEPEYILPYDVREVVKDSVTQIGQNSSLSFIDEQSFHADYPNPADISDPPTDYRLPEYSDSAYYSTGTVTMAASTAVVGSSTSWDYKMIGRGFRVSGESEVYEISDVTSTTALTLKRAYGGSNTGSGKSYEIDPAPCIKIWLYPFFTNARGIEFWYYQKPFPLVNNTDISEIPADMHTGILLCAEWLWHKYEQDDVDIEEKAEQTYRIWLFESKRKQRMTQDRRVGLKPHTDYVLSRW